MKNPIDLSIGYPEGETPVHIKLAGINAIRMGFTRYTPASGISELRSAIAEKLEKVNGIDMSPEAVSVLPGATTGILLTYLAVLNPGDEIIVPDPFFPPYRDLAFVVGAKPVFVDTYPDFRLRASEIAKKITRKTKAIILNTPNNPTGAVYPKSEIIKIARLAKRKNLLVISDEIYEFFTYGKPHFSIGSVYPNTITLNSFSKSYSMTGWRIGYAAGPREIIDAINELAQYTVFSTSSIAQKAALAAVKRPPTLLILKYKRKNKLVRQNIDVGRIYGMKGAYYAFIRTPQGMTDLEFAKRAEERNMIVLPGRAFSNRKDYIRISYAKKEYVLRKALRILNEIK